MRALLEPVGAAGASTDAVLLLAVIVTVTIGFWSLRALRIRALKRSRHRARDKVLSALQSVDRAIEEVRLSLPVVAAVRRRLPTIRVGPSNSLQNLDPQQVALPYRRAVWHALDRLHAAEGAAVPVLGEEVRERLLPVFRLAGRFMLDFYIDWDASAPPETREETRRSDGRLGEGLTSHEEQDNDTSALEFSAALKSAMDYYRECADPGT